MTVIELFHRMGRRARTHDFTQLDLSEQTDLAEAANSALMEMYGILPTAYKEMTEGFLLPAPATITATVTAQSAVLSTDVFTTDQIGRSVALDGDSNWNQVVDTDRMLHPYLGASGTVGGTVYGDAVYSTRYPFDRIIGNPSFPKRGGVMLYPELQKVNNGVNFPFFYAYAIGAPRVWWVQMMGNSQGSNPMMVLRVAPVPSIAMTVNVRMSYWPTRITMSDYDSATTLSAPDQFIENSFLPLCIQALSLMPVWDKTIDARRIDEAAERARTWLRNQPAQLAAPDNRIFTPAGF